MKTALFLIQIDCRMVCVKKLMIDILRKMLCYSNKNELSFYFE